MLRKSEKYHAAFFSERFIMFKIWQSLRNLFTRRQSADAPTIQSQIDALRLALCQMNGAILAVAEHLASTGNENDLRLSELWASLSVLHGTSVFHGESQSKLLGLIREISIRSILADDPPAEFVSTWLADSEQCLRFQRLIQSGSWKERASLYDYWKSELDNEAPNELQAIDDGQPATLVFPTNSQITIDLAASPSP